MDYEKIIYNWIKNNFGESEANDPSWNIKALAEHIKSQEIIADESKAAVIADHFTLSTIEAELADIKAFEDHEGDDLIRVLELAIKQIEG